MHHWKPKTVVTIHGIQTRGKWQKTITPYLAKHGLIPYHVDFGWYNALLFFLPWTRRSRVESVRKELETLAETLGGNSGNKKRISIIAHSFGTHIAMEALKSNAGQTLFYDRVVLTGSILPLNTPWQAMIHTDKWLLAVMNERVTGDLVVKLAEFVSQKLGFFSGLQASATGRLQFNEKSVRLLDREPPQRGGHSELLKPGNYERWARFIAYPMLPDDILEKLCAELQMLRQGAAGVLSTPLDKIRINLFAWNDGALRIVPGAVDNMHYAPEFRLAIGAGHGATGTAFSEGNPCIAVKRNKRWVGGYLPITEMEKVNPLLRWVISLPVKSKTRGEIIGVLNFDGLRTVPTVLEDLATASCKAAVYALYGSMAKRVVKYLDAAFVGETIEEATI